MVQADGSPGTIKSDETLFSIIETLHETNGAGVTEIASELNLAKSAVHKHLKTLEQNEYVTKHDNKYQLGFKFLIFGGFIRERNPLCRIATRKLDTIARDLNVVTIFSISEFSKGIVVGLYNELDVAIRTHVGQQFYLHQTAGGKAMLATYPDNEIRSIVEKTGLPAATEYTIDTIDELFDEMALIRDDGFATSIEESSGGAAAIAIAIEHPPTKTTGALTIATPVTNMTKEDLQNQYRDRLAQAVNEITYQIGDIN